MPKFTETAVPVVNLDFTGDLIWPISACCLLALFSISIESSHFARLLSSESLKMSIIIFRKNMEMGSKYWSLAVLATFCNSVTLRIN